MSKEQTVEERAEEEYPLIAAEGFGGANAIIMRQREAYIKGATDNQRQKVDYQKMFSNCSQPDQLREAAERAQDYARFAIECDRKGMPILEYNDWLKL